VWTLPESACFWRIDVDLFLATTSITNEVALLRLFFSFIAGGVIGFERASRRQSAGLRTHLLICLGSTLLMMLSIWMTDEFMDAKNGDPGRIAAQVVSGIGFLGAGSIIRLGNTVKGLTTAASLWFVAALGLGIGAGMYFPCLVALVIAMIALVALDPIERHFFPAERIKHLVITYAGNSEFPEHCRKILETYGLPVQSVDVEKNLKKGEAIVRYLVRVPNDTDTGELYKLIKALGGVERVELKEKF